MYSSQLHFPIRFKILLGFLLLATAVVTLIVYMMANFFHEDKTTYIRDLTSLRAVDTAGSVNQLMRHYRERLLLLAELTGDPILAIEQKQIIAETLFGRFEDFVAIRTRDSNNETVTVYDPAILENGNIDAETLYQQLDLDRVFFEIEGPESVFVANVKLSPQLSLLALATTYVHNNGEQSLIMGLVRLEQLLALAEASPIFETIIMDSQLNLLVHNGQQQLSESSKVDWIPDVEAFLQQNQVLSSIVEYQYNNIDMLAGLARAEAAGLLIVVQIPKATAYLTERELLNNLVLVSIGLLLTVVFLSMLSAQTITRPLEKLTKILLQVGEGRFDIKVPIHTQDEIGILANAVNEMITELNVREQKINDSNAALMHSQKMAAIGQLSAGITHEVKNPLAGILGYAQLALRKIQDDDPLKKNLLIIEKETKRCVKIINNLMQYARQGEVRHEQQVLDLNAIVQDSLLTVEQQLKSSKIEVKLYLAQSLSKISGNADRLKQVMINFLINAEQAMQNDGGIIRIATQNLGGKKIRLTVGDNGPGIPKEVIEKIFHPFFTTKDIGKGTGLGLSVTRDIIAEHQATIDVESEVGKGATFIVTFPTLRANAAIDKALVA